MIKNINTLADINKHDSLYIFNNNFIKKDNRYFKFYRPIYKQIDDIIQIIKSTFNNEILLIHLSKINNIETEDRLLRLQNAYRGVLNLLFYYNTYTTYGNQITDLIKYLDSQISSIENININKVYQTFQNSIKYTTEQDSDYSEKEDIEEDSEVYSEVYSEEDSEVYSEENSEENSEEESENDLNRSIYENIKNSIYNSTTNIKIIIIQVVTSFISAVKSIFTIF